MARFRIQAAPSAKTAIVPSRGSSPNRVAVGPQSAAKSVHSAIRAKANRAVGAGNFRSAHRSVPTDSPRSRLAKRPILTSFHLSAVFTIVPSVSNSASPAAVSNASVAAGASSIQTAHFFPVASATFRTNSSLTAKPQNAFKCRLAESNDQLAPAKLSRRRAVSVRLSVRPRRSSRG